MADTIEQLNHSRIQHGLLNNRVYLMNIDKRDYPTIFSKLDNIAEKKGYSKIFAKVPSWALEEAIKHDYIKEACIPELYNGENDGYFLGKYFTKSREKINEKTLKLIKTVKDTFHSYDHLTKANSIGEKKIIKEFSSSELTLLADLYKLVFKSYPFPIYEKSYLKQMMKNNVRYFGVFHHNHLLAASAAEIDYEHQCVEMTDFATHPKHRGHNYAFNLLSYMDKQMKKEQIRTAYTIARAVSFGMNITFAKAGYTYAGILKNNTCIAGNLESMNVLYKKLIN